MKRSPLIKPDELLSLHRDNQAFVLVDATNAGHKKYLENHLEGALFIDMDTQLADIKADAAEGGRHPLPSVEKFSETLSGLGITPESHVVIYDDKNGANAAARFWWMLKAAGHQNVQVLNGGFQAAVKAGFSVTNKIKEPTKTAPYVIKSWQLPQADINMVDKASQDQSFMIVDVRDPERYNGEKEPIDLIAGHIPNAVNIPLTTNLDAEGFYLPPEKLKEKYSTAFKGIKPENIIVHCGSGVTACHTLLAIDAAGLEIPRLYVGSWSEWSRNNKPMILKRNT